MYGAVVMTELIPIYSRGRYEGLARLIGPAGRPDHTRSVQPWIVQLMDSGRKIIRDISLNDITAPPDIKDTNLTTKLIPIYEDPPAETILEGYAQLLHPSVNSPNLGGLEQWCVQFEGERGCVDRWITPPAADIRPTEKDYRW